MRFVDNQGLAGHGTTLGAVQAGFEMVHRVTLPGAFGDTVIEGNRDILNFGGDIQCGPPDTWEPMKNIAYVTGTPPCSGFSLMNTSAATARNAGREVPDTARGPGSSINMCQRHLVEYAAKCTGTDGRPGADFASFESVQGAFSQGVELMREYWQMIQALTGESYNLVHVKMSVASIGGPQWRHRYFWLVHKSRIPFGINSWVADHFTTLEEAIGDLRGQPESWQPQDYVNPATSDFQRRHRRAGVLQHLSMGGLGIDDDDDVKAGARKHLEGYKELLEYWPQGAAIHIAAAEYLKHNPKLPDHLDARWQPDSGYFKGFMWPARTGWNRATGVLTGGCAGSHIHPDEPRFLTVRELSRIMDVPDDWSWDMARHVAQAGSWIGKCCTTGSGKWMGTAVMDALTGDPQELDNEFFSDDIYRKNKLELMPGERVFDITNEYRKLDQYKVLYPKGRRAA